MHLYKKQTAHAIGNQSALKVLSPEAQQHARIHLTSTHCKQDI